MDMNNNDDQDNEAAAPVRAAYGRALQLAKSEGFDALATPLERALLDVLATLLHGGELSSLRERAKIAHLHLNVLQRTCKSVELVLHSLGDALRCEEVEEVIGHSSLVSGGEAAESSVSSVSSVGNRAELPLPKPLPRNFREATPTEAVKARAREMLQKNAAQVTSDEAAALIGVALMSEEEIEQRTLGVRFLPAQPGDDEEPCAPVA